MNDIELLGRLLSKSKPSKAPKHRHYTSEHMDYVIAIGNDHIATITLDSDAVKELFEHYENLKDK